MNKAWLLLPLLWGNHSLAAEESPKDSCELAGKLYSKGDLDGALEEARWCVTLLEQERNNAVAALFKDEIAGFTGGNISHQQAFGFTSLERDYQKDQLKVNVSLAGGAAGGLVGALSVFSQLGLQSGQGQALRIQRRNAMVMQESGKQVLQVSLRSGGILSFTSEQLDAEQLKAFANEFPVTELDDALK
ncbi:hypothetical protein KJY73_08690 [Bowmanella sp. Y26]|uniref:hypothetical protein n=1 Tax=Bowmanella yangjiangensis TaxID=2811230 RepID=UPI001BDC9A77|nr:hypothetical protein [Bowmanella yangjiangensis]MBT1063648.1 hypothetical protein [Bowmanella yangjiangensis]